MSRSPCDVALPLMAAQAGAEPRISRLRFLPSLPEPVATDGVAGISPDRRKSLVSGRGSAACIAVSGRPLWLGVS